MTNEEKINLYNHATEHERDELMRWSANLPPGPTEYDWPGWAKIQERLNASDSTNT